MKRDFKGIWIPKSIWLDDSLTPTERCLLAEINSLDHGDGCFASNEFLAKRICMTEGSLVNLITKLRKSGWIETVKTDGRQRWLRVVKYDSNDPADGPCENGLCDHVDEDDGTYKHGVRLHKDVVDVAPPNKDSNSMSVIPKVPSGKIDDEVRQEQAEALYAIYPRKVGRYKAIQAAIKALKVAPFETLRSAVSEYAEAVKVNLENWGDAEMRFVPHPSSWFNAQRWTDDRSQWIKQPPKRTAFQINLLIKSTQDAIDTHVANSESINGIDNPTEAQKSELRELKTRLFNLREELNKTA